jgi:hypothetical protein
MNYDLEPHSLAVQVAVAVEYHMPPDSVVEITASEHLAIVIFGNSATNSLIPLWNASSSAAD